MLDAYRVASPQKRGYGMLGMGAYPESSAERTRESIVRIYQLVICEFAIFCSWRWESVDGVEAWR